MDQKQEITDYMIVSADSKNVKDPIGFLSGQVNAQINSGYIPHGNLTHTKFDGRYYEFTQTMVVSKSAPVHKEYIILCKTTCRDLTHKETQNTLSKDVYYYLTKQYKLHGDLITFEVESNKILYIQAMVLLGERKTQKVIKNNTVLAGASDEFRDFFD
jgi:hypothetical protein